MMKNEKIETLKGMVEERAGRKLKTPTDFNFLLGEINRTTKELLSLSTLKRIWEYVPSDHQPSASTLSILSRYAGFTGWDDFSNSFECGMLDDSEFLFDKQVVPGKLKEGDEVELRWEPNRRCRVVYIGDEHFRVLEAENSKLEPGDTFQATLFCLHHPLFLTDLRREGCRPRTYVAAKRKGITELRVLVTFK